MEVAHPVEQPPLPASWVRIKIMPISSDTERQALPCSICAALDQEFEYTDLRALYVVPTIKTTLESIPRWLETKARSVVIAPSVPQGLTPMQLLASLQSADRQQPVVAIVFSDQLTSASHAPMLVEHAGIHLYLSALEIVAHSNYRFDVRVWTGAGFEGAPAQSNPEDVLRLLLRYLAACEVLGTQWLMRDLQEDRYPVERITHARRRLRTFHSAVMHAFPDSPLSPTHQSLVKRIVEMQKAMTDPAST